MCIVVSENLKAQDARGESMLGHYNTCRCQNELSHRNEPLGHVGPLERMDRTTLM